MIRTDMEGKEFNLNDKQKTIILKQTGCPDLQEALALAKRYKVKLPKNLVDEGVKLMAESSRVGGGAARVVKPTING